MILRRLSIINFKNVAHCLLEPGEGVNCLVGDNGAGKTNVVDAIYYMSMCKSALGMTDPQCVRHGAGSFVLDGRYEGDSGHGEDIVCGFRAAGGKTVARGGKQYDKLTDHIGLVPVVIVSPADSLLISDTADERRRYLNAFLGQIDRDYLSNVMRYNHVLSQRNRLLKQAGSGADELLDVLDSQLCAVGGVVHAKRREAVERLAGPVADYYAALSDDREPVELTYRSQLNGRRFEDVLRECRQRDMAVGFSTAGIHRDDMAMTIGGHPLRKYGSQGQQKSFLVALKLGQYRIVAQERGERPLLLLDDLFDKLDTGRVANLLSVVGGGGFGQIFITDCNGDRLEALLRRSGLDYRLRNVVGGEVAQ